MKDVSFYKHKFNELISTLKSMYKILLNMPTLCIKYCLSFARNVTDSITQ